MPETLTQQKADDELFFERVKAQPVLLETLQRYALNRLVIRPSRHNSVLGITKEAWTLPRLAGQTRSLNVHFEARNRHEFRLELGLDPYIANASMKITFTKRCAKPSSIRLFTPTSRIVFQS